MYPIRGRRGRGRGGYGFGGGPPPRFRFPPGGFYQESLLGPPVPFVGNRTPIFYRPIRPAILNRPPIFAIIQRPGSPIYVPGNSSDQSLEYAQMEKLVQSSMELGYILAAPVYMHQEIKGIKDCLRSMCIQLDSFTKLVWDHNIEKLVKSLKICISRESSNAYASVAERSANDPSGGSKPRKPREPVATLATEVLLRICKLIHGNTGYNFYYAVFMEDYPMGFHFLDLLQPDVIEINGKFLSYDLLLRFILTSVKQAKGALAFTESKVFAHRTGYSSVSQTLAGSIDELLRSMLTLCENDLPQIDGQLVHSVLISILEVVPIERLSECMIGQILDFIVNGVENKPVKVERSILFTLIVQILKVKNPPSIKLAKRLLNTPGREDNKIQSFIVDKSIKHLQIWLYSYHLKSDSISKHMKLAVVGVSVLRYFAKFHFEDFKLVSNECFTNVLQYLNDFKLNVAEIEDFAQLVRRRCLPYFKTAEEAFEIYRNILSFIEVLIFTVDRWIETDSDCSGKESDGAYLDKFLDGVTEFFNIVPTLMNTSCPLIPQATLDCYAAIGNNLFFHLSDDQKVSCIVTVLGHARDDRKEVRDRAVRCLALYLDFQELVETETFMIDCLDLIEEAMAIKEDFSTYAWAYGNLTGVLAKHYNNKFPTEENIMKFLDRLMQINKFCFQFPKSQHNGCRALGNIFFWCPSAYFEIPEFRTVLGNALVKLENRVCIGSDFKARWNACYALGSILENTILFESAAGRPYIARILEVLSLAAIKTESLKEKINCISALSKLEKRELYEDMYFLVWERVFQSTKNNKFDLIRRNERLQIHRTEIIYKTAHCLAHLTSLMTDEDLSRLDDIIIQNAETFSDLVSKCNEIRLPKQQIAMENAVTNVLALKSNPANEKFEGLRVLVRIFWPDLEDQEDQDLLNNDKEEKVVNDSLNLVNVDEKTP